MTTGAARTALNGAIRYACGHGVLLVAIPGGLSSPYAPQVGGNDALRGKLQGQALGKRMGGKRNALLVLDIPQAPASNDFEKGHEPGLKEHPDIEIIGTVAGT